MILGDPFLDAVAFVVLCWVGAVVLLPLAQWIDYKHDCKKYGKGAVITPRLDKAEGAE